MKYVADDSISPDSSSSNGWTVVPSNIFVSASVVGTVPVTFKVTLVRADPSVIIFVVYAVVSVVSLSVPKRTGLNSFTPEALSISLRPSIGPMF